MNKLFKDNFAILEKFCLLYTKTGFEKLPSIRGLIDCCRTTPTILNHHHFCIVCFIQKTSVLPTIFNLPIWPNCHFQGSIKTRKNLQLVTLKNAKPLLRFMERTNSQNQGVLRRCLLYCSQKIQLQNFWVSTITLSPNKICLLLQADLYLEKDLGLFPTKYSGNGTEFPKQGNFDV